MANVWDIDGFTLILVGVAVITVLEIFFLFARMIESETSLHDLRVHSHTLRRQMIEQAAQELIDQRDEAERALARAAVRPKHAASSPVPADQQSGSDADESIVMPEESTDVQATSSMAA